MTKNGIITAPVSMGEVNALLGTSHTSLSALCRSREINGWSRIKPLNDPRPVLRVAEGGAWKGTDGCCGLSVPVVTHLSALMPVPPLAWAYIRPYTAYRLADFAGYDHTARPFVTGCRLPAYITVQDNRVFAASLVQGLVSSGEGDVGSIQRADITVGGKTLAEMYFGVAAFSAAEGGGYTFRWAQTSNLAGELTANALHVPTTIGLAIGDEVYLVPFLSAAAVDLTTADVVGTYIVPPQCAPALVTIGTAMQASHIASMAVSATAKALYALDGSFSSYSGFTISAEAVGKGSAHTYPRCSVTIWRGKPEASGSELVGTAWQGSITLGDGTDWTLSTTLPGVVTASATYYVSFYIAYGSFRSTVLVITPAPPPNQQIINI